MRQQHILDKGLSQALCIDETILKGFIQTGPFALEKGRLRQLGKGLGLRLAKERIHRIEEGCLGSLKAMINLVTIVYGLPTS
jgi:hypothetical protein